VDNPAEKSIAIFAPAALFLALMLECRDSMLVITRWLIILIAEPFAGRSLLHPMQPSFGRPRIPQRSSTCQEGVLLLMVL
jgi:hypothetical protein